MTSELNKAGVPSRHDFDRVMGVCRRCGKHAAKVGGRACHPAPEPVRLADMDAVNAAIDQRMTAAPEPVEEAEGLEVVAWRYDIDDINGDPWPWVYTDNGKWAEVKRERGYNVEPLTLKSAADARITALQAALAEAVEINRLAFGSQALKQRAETAEASLASARQQIDTLERNARAAESMMAKVSDELGMMGKKAEPVAVHNAGYYMSVYYLSVARAALKGGSNG